jgi:O-antigen ligase
MKEPRIGRKSGSRARRPPPSEGFTASRWLTAVIAAGALVIPVLISWSGDDTFRYPKELALRAEVLVIIAILAIAWGFGRIDLPPLDLRATWLRLTAAICAWTIVCALLSMNRRVSIPPTARVLAFAVLFVITVLILRRLPVRFAGIIVLPAIVNSVIYILQELEIWSPFDTSAAAEKHLARTALVGNPNDVGSYLIVAALVAAALALSRTRGRLVWAGAAVLILVGTYMTHTVAAIGAVAVALLVMLMLWLRSWRARLAALLPLVVFAAVPFAAYPPLRNRALLMRDAVARRDFETLSAARTLPFLTAAAMIGDRPLTGVGPGGFAYNFFDYKLRLQLRRRELFEHTTEMNFGEVHNDHLQVAAETGLPGYALFLAALLLLGSASWRRAGSDDAAAPDRAAFVHLLALPLAVSMFILALAQFPLELIAPTHSYLWAAAAVVAWRDA